MNLINNHRGQEKIILMINFVSIWYWITKIKNLKHKYSRPYNILNL